MLGSNFAWPLVNMLLILFALRQLFKSYVKNQEVMEYEIEHKFIVIMLNSA